MGGSEDKNHISLYLESGKINWKALIKTEYQEEIFHILSIRFNFNAEKNSIEARNYHAHQKEILSQLSKNCAEKLKRIYELTSKWWSFNQNEDEMEDVYETVQEIMDMDYESKKAFFNTLRERFKDNEEIRNLFDEINSDLSQMQEISGKIQ